MGEDLLKKTTLILLFIYPIYHNYTPTNMKPKAMGGGTTPGQINESFHLFFHSLHCVFYCQIYDQYESVTLLKGKSVA